MRILKYYTVSNEREKEKILFLQTYTKFAENVIPKEKPIELRIHLEYSNPVPFEFIQDLMKKSICAAFGLRPKDIEDEKEKAI